MELTQPYKQTEIGRIPKDWTLENIGSVGSVRMCKRIFNHQTHPDGKIPFYKIGTFGKEPDAYISEDLYNSFRQKFSYPKKGDILISAAGTIGRTLVYDGEPAYYQDSNIVWVENDGRLISNDLLFHVFKIVKYNTEGGTIQRLYNSILKAASFALPPTKHEQLAISNALSDADAYVESLQKIISKKLLIRKALLRDLFAPMKDWKSFRLGECATLKARIGWQGLTTAEYLDSGAYGLVTGTDFKNGKIDWDNCHYVAKERYDQDRNIQLRANDILVTKDGTIGKVAFVDFPPLPTTLNSGVFVIRPINNSFVSKCFYYLLSSTHFEDFLAQLAAGSTISHLYQKDFVHFKFKLPQQEAQEKIGSILSDLDNEIELYEKKLRKARLVRQGMMQDLLTGKIRLV